MSVRKTKDARYKCDYQDKFRGIARVKRTFDTKKEAQEWEAKLRSEGHANLMGRRVRRLFGEALAEYLRDIAPHKPGYDQALLHARYLRFPYRDRGRWIWLEDVPLEGHHDELTIVPALHKWIADAKRVRKRSRLVAEIYHLRDDDGELIWWQQPKTTTERPLPRVRIEERALLARLHATKGSGPFSGSTLRIRQVLVSVILRHAFRPWRWTTENLAKQLEFERPAGGRQARADEEQLLLLVKHARPGLNHAILGAVLMGWRRSNLLALTWERVRFPQYELLPDGTQVQLQPGVCWVERINTKNKKHTLIAPMDDRLEPLLRTLWEARQGPYVFHDGAGDPLFGDYRKHWAAIKRLAGLPPDFRWHDLRHTWASNLADNNVSDRVLQVLGGWTNASMVTRYTHVQVKALRQIVNDSRRGR